MPICTQCGVDIITGAECWPAKGGGKLCQVCWEADCSGSWWEMVEWACGGIQEPAKEKTDG